MKQIILVQWVDSCGNDNWIEDNYRPTLTYCETIGYLFAETDESITIVSTKTKDEQYLSHLTIPKCAITGQWNIDIHG